MIEDWNLLPAAVFKHGFGLDHFQIFKERVNARGRDSAIALWSSCSISSRTTLARALLTQW